MKNNGSKKAFVLYSTIPNEEKDVYSELREISGVEEIHLLAGHSDGYVGLAEIVAKDFDDIGKAAYKIKKINGVLHTKTLMGI